MRPLEHIFERARQLRRHIILSEGEDPRIREAGFRAVETGLADITLLGRSSEFRDSFPQQEHGGRLAFIDPQDSEDNTRLAEAYLELRAHKGMTAPQAVLDVQKPLVHAAMRVRLGLADGTVGGAVATTAETVRTGLQLIGRAPGARLVSSFFLMLACDPRTAFKGGVIFSDCGLVIEPSAEELASIARSAAQSCRTLLGAEPQVAMLSFSTAGSAEHESLSRIRRAIEIVRSEEPALSIHGELQFDAAFEEAVRHKKYPDSRLTGRPNVFVFPNLASGNIGYKIAQRLGHLEAVGPILQGLAQPANDLSRGCSVDDIVAAIAVTALQSVGSAKTL